MSEARQIAYPEWTEYRKKNGLDPLGMLNTSVALYQKLLPGISNVTLRIRYYGFYAWLSWVYANRIGHTDPKTWQRFVRRAEALYALIAQRRGHETGVAGIQWAEKKIAAAKGSAISFADDAEPGSATYYLKQAWGAYGAAYASQLFEVGIFDNAAQHVIPVPSPEIGEELAKSFAAECGPLAERFFVAIERGEATLDEIDALIPMTPSGIRADSHERQLYQNILFASAGLDRAQEHERRNTLLLILELAHLFGHTPDSNEIRWALYAGYLPDGTVVSLPNQELQLQRRRWSVYQANDLIHICFETLLKFTLDALEVHRDGLPLARLIGDLVAAILAIAEPRPLNWNAFLETMVPAGNSCSATEISSEIALTEQVMRAARPENLCGPEGAWTALRLLAILHNRLRLTELDVKSELARFDPNNFRSALTEVKFLETHLNDDFAGLLARLIEERVVRRHLQIAIRKLRFQGDYTFLIETDDGRVRLREKDGPVFTNPRLAPTITFLKDIHLLGNNGLTPTGLQQIGAAV